MSTTSNTGHPAMHMYRDHYGLYAKSTAPLFDDFILEVTTRKGSSRVLTTRASVHKVEGNSLVHRVYQDYSRCVFKTEPKRVTEKAIAEQHTQAIKVWDTLVQEACAHTRAAEGIDG